MNTGFVDNPYVTATQLVIHLQDTKENKVKMLQSPNVFLNVFLLSNLYFQEKETQNCQFFAN